MPDEKGRTRTLFVAGRFDNEGGKASTVAKRILNGWVAGAPGCPMASVNGGQTEMLQTILGTVPLYDNVVWMPDVPNEADMSNLAGEIKKCILVTSKQNFYGKYTFGEVLDHILQNKANLTVEFTGEPNHCKASVLDPLSNSLIGPTDDFEEVGRALAIRTAQLATFTRVSSVQVGEQIQVPTDNPPADYYALVRELGEIFARTVFGAPSNVRFMGNMSFRCLLGFSLFKSGDLIFVSGRNIDKQFIQPEDFVAVNAGKLSVEYYGGTKPSIDTPIHVLMYDFYNNVNYIVHGHAYVEDAPFTLNNVPFGAVQEADEIFDLYPRADNVDFAVNLIGHGFVALARDFDFFRKLTYIPRERPEMLPNWETPDYSKRIARHGKIVQGRRK